MTARARRRGALLAAWLGAAGLLAACRSEPATPQQAARRAVEALAARDFGALADLVHPEDGVRFSPYATVDPRRDVVLSADELRNAAGDDTPLLWGEYDGTGDPIRLTFDEYFRRFVYGADFAVAGQVATGRRLGYGNSLDNVAEVYPGATTVEYHVDGVDPELGGMDWQSLRLVLEPHGGGWALVGIVHDQWTT